MTALIETKDLQRTFSVSAGMFKPRQTLHAVNGVDLSVQRKMCWVSWANRAVVNQRLPACYWV